MYPLTLLSEQSPDIFPLFGKKLQGNPYMFDFSSDNPKTLKMDTNDFDAFQSIIFDELARSGASWGIGRYLEERKNILKNFPQMIREGRIYHLGLDIIVPKGYVLFAPLSATVYRVGKEEELGSYGGYVVLKHEVQGDIFYSLYGHLDSNHIVQEGQILDTGESFAHVGERSDSGGWFTHTHLQIITKKAADAGRMFQGYIAASDLSEIENLFPNPYLLFRY